MISKDRLAGIGNYLLGAGGKGIDLARNNPKMAALGLGGTAALGYMAYKSTSQSIQPVTQTEAIAASNEPAEAKPQPVRDYKPQYENRQSGQQNYQRQPNFQGVPAQGSLTVEDVMKERLRLQKEKGKLEDEMALAGIYQNALGA